MSDSPLTRDLYYQIPSLQHFVNRIVDDLAEGRNALILFPAGISSDDIWPPLRSLLWYRDFDFKELQLGHLGIGISPISFLASVIGFQWQDNNVPRTATYLLENAKQTPNLVYLDGFDELELSDRQKWLRFLVEWARASHSAADRGQRPMALCIIAEAREILEFLPTTDIYLGIYWWWGFPSALEMKLLCRYVADGRDSPMISSWKEHLLPVLVGSDLGLAKHLWETFPPDTDKIIRKLRDYSDEQGWDAQFLKELGSSDLRLSPIDLYAQCLSEPFEGLRRLWAYGLVSFTPEYGLQLNSSALLVLGQKQEVLHRIWRGQAELLLPILDQTRLTICNELTRKYGGNWPYRWIKPNTAEEEEAVKKDPLACQFGHLEYLLRTCRHLKPQRAWLQTIKCARLMRNELAHYRPVDFRDFRRLVKAVQILGC